jgi:hypothetical protein
MAAISNKWTWEFPVTLRDSNPFGWKFTKKDSNALAALISSLIRIRTQNQHKNMFGSGFKAYSKGYAKQKQRAGRNARVDLTYTGEMMGSLGILKDRTGGKKGSTFTNINFTMGPSMTVMAKSSKAMYVTAHDKTGMFGAGHTSGYLIGNLVRDRPSNNAIGYFLQIGANTGGRKARPWLGIQRKGSEAKAVKMLFSKILGKAMTRRKGRRIVISN